MHSAASAENIRKKLPIGFQVQQEKRELHKPMMSMRIDQVGRSALGRKAKDGVIAP